MIGTATRRAGKPYIYATWVAKLLGGHQCLWSAWFRAHFKHQKFEESAADLVKWNRDHTKLMAARQRALEAEGWTCVVEDDNSFKLEGQTAVVAGKPDLIAFKGDEVRIVDGKTGRERDSDLWQVLLYLWAFQKVRPDLADKTLSGEVCYRADIVTLTPDDIAGEKLDRMLQVIKVVGGDDAPPKKPTRAECRMCTIGPRDCPERVGETQSTGVGEF